MNFRTMVHKCFMLVCCTLFAAVPLSAQEKMYPVRAANDTSVVLNSDRSAFVVEKAFQHKLTLGFPDDDVMDFLPNTKAAVAVFWIRIQNVSTKPLQLHPEKFATTDDQGKTYAALTADEAFNRIIASATDGSLGTKTLRGISLGRVGTKRTEEQVKEDFVRYSLASIQLAPGAAKEGLIYFEAPQRKKFTFNVTLGDLWSKPFPFSTEKQK